MVRPFSSAIKNVKRRNGGFLLFRIARRPHQSHKLIKLQTRLVPGQYSLSYFMILYKWQLIERLYTAKLYGHNANDVCMFFYRSKRSGGVLKSQNKSVSSSRCSKHMRFINITFVPPHSHLLS